jgi:hypothetical protein
MIITGAAGLPSAKTVLVAVRFKPQPSKPATSAASADTVSAPAASRRADWAASAGDSVKAFGGATAIAGAAGGGGVEGSMGAATAGTGANRFAGSSAIASSAPISTYQRNSAIAASRSSNFGGVAGEVIRGMLPSRPSDGDPI